MVAMNLAQLREAARRLKRETTALYFAARDPRSPWVARLVGGFVVAYALSPLDLIPDFIPVIGLLDDLILLPLGIRFAIRLIPPHVMAEARVQALEAEQRPSSLLGAAIIIGTWLLFLAAGAWLYVTRKRAG